MNKLAIAIFFVAALFALSTAAPDQSKSVTKIWNNDGPEANVFESFLADSPKDCWQCSQPCPSTICCDHTGYPQCCRVNGVCGCCRLSA